MRLLTPSDLDPLVESIGRNQATLTPERSTKCGLGIDRLGPSVDGAVTELRLLGPGGQQPPLQAGKLIPAFRPPDGRNQLAWRDIVARL